jgi:Xaa-Pro aminopeptidase
MTNERAGIIGKGSSRAGTGRVATTGWRARARAVVVMLLGIPASMSAQEGTGPFAGGFPPEEFAARREKVYDAIGGTGVALVQGASGFHSSTRFRQSNQFYYLTGIETPNAYLLLDGRRRQAVLYLPHRDAGRAATDGEVLTAEDSEAVRRLTGVDLVLGTEALAEQLGRRSAPGTVIYTPFQPAEGHSESRGGILRATADMAADPWDGRPSREGHFIGLLRSRFPFLEVRDLSPALDEMRRIKSPREIEAIRRATRIGNEALIEAMRSTRPGVREHELDAVARFIFTRHGAQGEAYRAIVASGPNAWYAHHRAAGRELQDGELVLMDYCPDVAYYRCDVTRQWPVGGRFSPVQRELYGFYLGYYEAILYSIRPGLTPQQVRREALPKMEAVLARTRFSKPEYERAARSFVEAFRESTANPDVGLGHGVGMATHDFGPDSGPLRAGMVFTIEPQFRVPEERIYIRLEDMIVITDSGVEILSDMVPRDIDGVERLVREEGLLQRYPGIRLSDKP